MSTIIRDNRSKKGTMSGSRQRFLRRNREQIKRAVQKSFESGNVTDNGKGGIDITLPKRGVKEPFITHDPKTGKKTRILPGNKQFNVGDRIKRPQGGGGGGSQASDQGEGEDDFVFHLSEKEFYDFLFEGLELPNFDKRGQQESDQTKSQRAGIVSDGTPNNLDLERSAKKRMGRRFSVQKGRNREILELETQRLSILDKYNDKAMSGFSSAQEGTMRVKIKKLRAYIDGLTQGFEKAALNDFLQETADIDEEIEKLERKNKHSGRWNETDLRYRNFEQKPIHISKAVMFCIMDVSGSMDQETKNNAKLFYVLLHKFLQKHYDQTDVVFIRYHTNAKEVNEEEFFYGKETGGTIVSTGLEKMLEIIKERYPKDQWNIYGAQASDGDNFGYDTSRCIPLMEEILAQSQGHWYTEITQREPQELWHAYNELSQRFSDKFWIGKIEDRQDIPAVFRDFFQKRGDQVSVNAYSPPHSPK